MTTFTITPGQHQEARANATIGQSWTDDKGKTWVVGAYKPIGSGYLTCKVKGSRGGAGSVEDLSIDQVWAKLGIGADPTVTAASLIGKSWTWGDDTWIVTEAIFGGEYVRANLGKTDISRTIALADVIRLIDGTAGDKTGGPARAAELAADPIHPTELIGRSWQTPDGGSWEVTSFDPDEPDMLLVEDAEGFGQLMSVVDILQELGMDNTPPAEDLMPDVLVEAIATGLGLTAELANAGSDKDDQYINRQSVPGPRMPKRWHLPANVIASIEAEMQSLIALLGRHGGSGKVTFNGKAKYKAADEIEFAFEVGLTPPKLKSSGFFFDGDEIMPGLPKREPDGQKTIFEAPAAKADVTDDDDQVDALTDLAHPLGEPERKPGEALASEPEFVCAGCGCTTTKGCEAGCWKQTDTHCSNCVEPAGPDDVAGTPAGEPAAPALDGVDVIDEDDQVVE